MERIATRQEIDNHWTLEDIYKANALLDMQADVRAAQQKGGRK